MFLWDWIRGVGGNREAEAVEREEYGGDDPGESELKASEAFPSLAGSEAAEIAEADLAEFKPPRDPAP
jgi:hypothetical protein